MAIFPDPFAIYFEESRDGLIGLGEITTHEGDALARLATQYQNKPLMVNMARLAGVRAQSIEDVLWDIYSTMGLSINAALSGGFTLATGAQLDLLGKLVGKPRNGLDDAFYTLVLQAQMLVLFTSGSISDILSIFKILLPINTIVLTETFPAGFLLNVGFDISNETAQVLLDILHEARAAGVNGQLLYSPTFAANTFTYDGTSDQAYDAGEYSGALL